jgi:hypothetical protein
MLAHPRRAWDRPLDVALCAGFRTTECRDYPRVLTAGVRKAPRHEIAVGSAPAVRRALWGFGGGAWLDPHSPDDALILAKRAAIQI